MKYVIYSFLFALCAMTTVSYGFNTLARLQEYVDSVEEYPDNDSDNWLHPDFLSFYKSIVPGYTKRFLSWTGISHKGWDARAFAKQRELVG